MRNIIRFFTSLFGPKNLFHIDNLLSFGFALIVLFGISRINFEIINPIGEAFADVDITDLAFSHMGKNDNKRGVNDKGLSKLDTNIVIVNIGYLSRKEIAEQIFKINECGAKVIGIDADFLHPKKNVMGDMMLQSAINFGGNVILMSKGLNYNVEEEAFEDIQYSHEMFNSKALGTGFTNVVTDNEGSSEARFNICRMILVGAEIKSEKRYENAFTVELAKRYDSTAVQDLFKRGNTEEFINFSGDMYREFNKFSRYKAFDVNYRDKDWCSKKDFEGKIVLMGFLGRDFSEVTGEDKFFTPLNHKYIGKSNRDMYGVILHANSISMILDRNYINELPIWLGHVLGFLITYVLFAAFRGIFNDYKVWYDGLTKLISLILIVVLLGIELFVFDAFNYKLSISGLYFGIIAFSGDFLEIYYGLLKNLFFKIVPSARKII